MIILKATTETLEIVTSTMADIDYSISYADIMTTTFSPSTSEGKITSAAITTVLAAPAASTQRQVKLMTIYNRHASASNTVTVNKDISAVNYNLVSPTTLLPGETLQYIDSTGWVHYSVTGAIKNNQPASGSNSQIQFNSNGVLSSDIGLTWDNTNHDLILDGTGVNIITTGITNEPAAPSSGTAVLYTKAVVGKMQLKIKGPSGLDTPIQAVLWQNNIVWWQPQAAAGVYTGTVGANLGGTNNLVLPTTTNLYTMMRRSNFGNSTGTGNQQMGIRTENMFFLGNATGMGGFLFACRFGFDLWTAGDRLFVGLCVGTAAVVTVQPSTLLNTAGFCIEAGDTAISFLHNDGSGTGVKTAIAGQPALATNNGYDAYIWCAPNSTTVYYRLDNVLTGTTIVDSSIVGPTDVPAVNTLLAAQCIIGNAANGSGTALIGVNRMYIETDR